ncbi:unnamed protein product [Amoebophrya sp. A25]|nr:unnamed protein product [Amoebophrya sp. A25]|eukprot:GSA25T00025107001.1
MYVDMTQREWLRQEHAALRIRTIVTATPRGEGDENASMQPQSGNFSSSPDYVDAPEENREREHQCSSRAVAELQASTEDSTTRRMGDTRDQEGYAVRPSADRHSSADPAGMTRPLTAAHTERSGNGLSSESYRPLAPLLLNCDDIVVQRANLAASRRSFTSLPVVESTTEAAARSSRCSARRSWANAAPLCVRELWCRSKHFTNNGGGVHSMIARGTNRD